MEKNFTSENIPYELILGEHQGTLSAGEIIELQKWKQLSARNMAVYQETIDLFLQTDLLAVRAQVDVQKNWESFSQNLQPREAGQKKRNTKILGISGLWWSAAAVLLIGIAIIVQLGKSSFVDISTGIAERKHFIFPDGSEAVLNQNTTISYTPERFSHEREVVLRKGEAYFTVKHDQTNPFRIRAGALQVEDLGTSFNLKLTDEKIAVLVTSGLVSLQKAGSMGNKVLLNPHDKGIFDRETEQIDKTQNQFNNDKAWIDSTFNYQSTPLQEVAKEIAEVYHVKISFKNERLKKRRLSASFRSKRIEEIMEIISKTLRIKAVRSDKGYILSE